MTTGSDAPILHTYDFHHPARVNRDQLRTLEALHDNGARLLGSTLSGVMRAIVEVEPAFVDQTTYREFVASLSNPSSTYQFTLGPTSGQAIMDFELPLVYGAVDRLYGGKGSSRGVDLRQMTQLEMGLFAKVVIRAMQDLEALWEPVAPVGVYDIELETNPEFMQVSADNEIVVLVAWHVKAANMEGLVRICYPFFTLESLLPRLMQVTPPARQRQDREQIRARNRLSLGAMDLPAVAELGRTRLPAGTAAQLQAGDVIRLDGRTDEPACLFLGGRPQLLGFPCADEGGRVSLQIAGRVPPSHVAQYGDLLAPPSQPHDVVVGGRE